MTSSLQPALGPCWAGTQPQRRAASAPRSATASAPAVVTNLSLRANAYYDNQRYDSSGQPLPLTTSLHLM